jgi:ABC-type glycerol-3-phosphate transport system substrate-binding protein
MKSRSIKASLAVVAAILALVVVGCAPEAPKAKTAADFKGQTLKLWSFTNELQDVVDRFKADYPGVEVTYTIVPSEQYLAKIKPVLKNGGDEAPDVFTGEAAFMKDFVEDAQWDDLSKAPYNADLSAITPYVTDLSKDAAGAIRGISWQATAGGWFYNRELAKQYFGTDDPAAIGALIADWDKFLATARELKQKSGGKAFMISSLGDLFNPFYASRSSAWVVGDKFVFDPALKPAIELAKTMRSEGLDAKAGQWSPPWFNGMKKGSNVFLYILPTWGLHYVLKTNAPDGAGQWGLATGPTSYFWGGTWLGIYPKSANKELAWEFIKYFTLNKETLKWWATKTGDFLANTEVVGEIKDTFSEPYLGGQNHYAYFAGEVPKINGKLFTRYDQQANTFFQNAVTDFTEGKIKTADDVVAKVKSDFRNAYEDLKVE